MCKHLNIQLSKLVKYILMASVLTESSNDKDLHLDYEIKSFYTLRYLTGSKEWVLRAENF